jgi:hypothetical protein
VSSLQSTNGTEYPLRLIIDYPQRMSRVTTLFRLILVIPIIVILGIVSAQSTSTYVTSAGAQITQTSAGILGALFLALVFMLLFRKRYPRWWFAFLLEYTRFAQRVAAYIFLLTDQYPSTEDQQTVHLDVDYPEVERLNRGLPLVKWFLATPHYIVLASLGLAVLFITIVAYFAIVITGRYPRVMFDFVVGFSRWAQRVNAYAFLLVTDKYPPFSLR